MHELVQNLRDNFLGKLCTVLTQPVSFPFKDGVQHSQFFSGKVVDVNQYGIWMKHPRIGTYAFFTFPIVGIVEEEFIADTDPRANKIKEELKRQEEKKQPQSPCHKPHETFIPVESLTNMIKKKPSS